VAPRAGLRVSRTPPNKRMHATADMGAVMYCQGCGATRDARR